MKYVVPVNAPEEVGPLVDAGAGELYCGYQDAWWVDRYGDHDSASRRQGFANLSTVDELARTAAAAVKHKTPLYLALNTRYTEPQLDYLQRVCADFEQMGGTGVIVSDLGLLWRLRGNTGLVRCLSLLAVAQSAATMKAFGELGVSRVVLPRFVGPDKARKLLAMVPGLQGEFMAFFDKCPLVDGYCRYRHGVSYGDRIASSGSVSADVAPLYTFDTTYRTHACLSGSNNYLDPYPCAACYLGPFERAGVGFAKLGGRGRPLGERLGALRFLKHAEALSDDAARRDLYRETYDRDCSCYYGPCIQDRSAVLPVSASRNDGDRVYIGSQTDYAVYRAALERLHRGEIPDAEGAVRPLTILVPPLDDEEIADLVAVLRDFACRLPEGSRVCLNDLGALVTLAHCVNGGDLPLRLSMGTLLAREDDPKEIARFMSSAANPPRPIWDFDGKPRMLTYRRPPASLIEHWGHPSAIEPSAAAAIRSLVDGMPVLYEFGIGEQACGAPFRDC